MLEMGWRATRSGEGCKARTAALKGDEGICKHFLDKNALLCMFILI